MKKELVEGYNGLVKVDKSYIVNEDDIGYKQALERRLKTEKEKQLNSRVDRLEGMISEVLDLLRSRS